MGTDWTAPWIQPRVRALSSELSPLRAEINCDDIASARLCITALGIYRLKINGKAIGEDDLLPPGCTQYDKRVLYRVYDIGDALGPGRNVLDIVLANGWFSGRIARQWNSDRSTWGERPLLRCELRLGKKDGSIEVLPLDSNNVKYCHTNDKADIYEGTIIEAWHSLDALNPQAWVPVAELKASDMPVLPKIEWSASEPVDRKSVV